MAKTAKLKKKQAAPHSRAARRAASPSIPVPSITRQRSASPKPSEARHHILSTQTARVSKRKTTKLTRAQRVRAERAMDRAADDMDKWEKKKAKSIEKAQGIKDRAKLWDDVNEETLEVLGDVEGDKKAKAEKAKLDKGKMEKGKADKGKVDKGKVDKAMSAVEGDVDQGVWVDVEGDMDDAVPEPDPVDAPTTAVEEDELL